MNVIRKLRKDVGITQQDLAEKVGVRRETIIFLEKNKYNPSLGLADKIAKVFDKSIEEVFGL